MKIIVAAAPGFSVLEVLDGNQIWREPVVAWEVDTDGGSTIVTPITIPVGTSEKLSLIEYPDGRVFDQTTEGYYDTDAELLLCRRPASG